MKNKKIKKTALGLIMATVMLLPNIAFAAPNPYDYYAAIVWHNVTANGGSSFAVTAPNPSISGGTQRQYKGAVTKVKYVLENSKHSYSFNKSGIEVGFNTSFGTVAKGDYYFKMINLYDDNSTAFTAAGTLNY